MLNPKAKEAVEWFSANKSRYEILASKVESIVREILDSKGINYHSINSRLKSIDSYSRKASKDGYKSPISEIFDMAGIRIITYTDSDAKKVSRIIKDAFDIDLEHSVDKTTELGVDKMGYRSIHYVGTLGKKRLELPENEVFKGMCFEIQIRSILQHAWAEFEHDRNYKFAGVLPDDLKRRFSLLAGILELTDREFDSLLEDIDAYYADVERRADKGDLSTPINSTSLLAYMNKKFEALVALGVNSELIEDAQVVDELHEMGIDSLEQLDGIIPKNFVEIKAKYLPSIIGDSFLGILRDIMIIHDTESYFKRAWKGKWSGTDRGLIFLCKDYGIDLEKYVEQYNLDVM